VPLKLPPGVTRRVTDVDNRVDSAFGRLRGNRSADRLFYGASAIGDHGMMWVGLAALRAARGGSRNREAAVRVAVGVVVESIVVNIGIKSLFRRRRPRTMKDFAHPLHLRVPRTSSFPSGHATSAFTAATLLADGDPLGPLYFAAAGVVAASRVYVKIHHASDVIAGVALGLAMGQVGKRLFPLESTRPPGG
jgi:undecaprenyl-diphosphatase